MVGKFFFKIEKRVRRAAFYSYIQTSLNGMGAHKLTSPQLCSYIQTSKKLRASLVFQKKFPNSDFPYLWAQGRANKQIKINRDDITGKKVKTQLKLKLKYTLGKAQS